MTWEQHLWKPRMIFTSKDGVRTNIPGCGRRSIFFFQTQPTMVWNTDTSINDPFMSFWDRTFARYWYVNVEICSKFAVGLCIYISTHISVHRYKTLASALFLRKHL